ncbi:MAG: type II toxin-antitoxin system Phd/YefM family antitoxin [Actinomycetia bacterium]|nr:type II toxin-antitoxin system Phd/YefM family antitoxin [Actinomycetes bacterium]
MLTVTLTDARARLSEVVDHARVNHEPVYLTRRNKRVAAIVSLEQLADTTQADTPGVRPGEVDESLRDQLDELSRRASRHLKPGTPPLIDVHGFHETRPPRL